VIGVETRPSILLVDDDPTFRERLGRALSQRGYDVTTAGGVDSALVSARAESPELAVVDLKMPGRSGLELVRELQALDPATRIVVLTGYGSIATAVEAMRLGAVHYLAKPADADEILVALERRPGSDPATAEFPMPTLARVEWEYMQRVLAECKGNVSEAARRLGMHRRSLQRKLQKLPPNE
jgi:two-component system response regulator RegA